MAGDVQDEGTIENCYNTGDVSGENDIGGVAGENSGTIKTCYNIGDVSGSGNYVGGVAGYNIRGTTENCYNTGDVSGNNYVGGVAGYSDYGGTIKNCYNTGDVNGNDLVGGVAGFNHPYGTVINCFSTGDVKGNNRVGGVAGRNNEGIITNCYYDAELCKDKRAIGTADDTDNVKGLTTKEMTGTGALKNMEFTYGTGETPPWMEKANETCVQYYPHLEGFLYDTTKDPEDWPPSVRNHIWSIEWSTNGDNHWHECSACGAKKDEVEHTWKTEWSTDGDKHWHECTVCGKKNGETVHTWVDATCTEAKTCEICDTTEGNPLGHKYGEWIIFDINQHQRVCSNDKTHIEKANHSWDAGKETKAATEQAEGVKAFTCTVCKATKTETIPKLDPTPKPDPKPVVPKVSGTPLAKLTAKKKSITISWNKIQGAAGYDIFFARCNHDRKKIVTKKVKTIKGNKTFKWTKSGLKKGTAYKAYVRAYVYKNGKKTYVRSSPLMHAYTGKGTKNYTNAKSVSVNKTKVTLKKEKTFKIKAKVKKVNKNKKLMPKSHAPTLRYMTSNSKIASVNSGGKITAKGKGTCYIYVYAHNGVSKQVKVTVK